MHAARACSPQVQILAVPHWTSVVRRTASRAVQISIPYEFPNEDGSTHIVAQPLRIVRFTDQSRHFLRRCNSGTELRRCAAIEEMRIGFAQRFHRGRYHLMSL